MGINHSRACCCYHDSYSYCPYPLWTLFALEVQVYGKCATRETKELISVSLGMEYTRTCRQAVSDDHYPAYLTKDITLTYEMIYYSSYVLRRVFLILGFKFYILCSIAIDF